MITIEGYSDIVRIGQGGLGDVYRATRDSTGGTVAIKVLRDVSDESVAWHRTRRELTALVSLAGHANVIQLLELLELPEGPALVMEYAPGGSVADMMSRRDETLSVGEVVFIGRHTATALVAAHAAGIVHRDVKPQNLLIDAYGQVKLCDFGIAAIARTEEFRTRTNAISMRYASPEDLDDEIDVGPPADVYSLGATLLHLARGAPPTLKERLAPWQPPTADDPDLTALDAIVSACLHPSIIERPTAAQVVDELERLSWSMDERNRSLASPDTVGVDAPTIDDAPTDPSAAPTTQVEHPPIAESDQPPPTRPPLSRPAPGTDETVARPDRRPPPRPTPVLPASRRRWGLIAAVVFGVAALGAGAWWWSQLGSGESGDPVDGSLVVVDRPAGLADLRSMEWPIGLPGVCLVQTAGATVLDAVDCIEPHDLQRVSDGELDEVSFPMDAPFDEELVRAVVRDECDAAFEVFVGVEPAASDLEVAFSSPSVDTWLDGDRRFQCLVGVPGQRLTRDAASFGR